MNNYLIEIGVEELPARYIEGALNSFKSNMIEFLEENHLGFEDVLSYATPRRLTLIVEGLVDAQEDVHEEVRGPAKKIAYLEDGSINKPLEGFMRGQNITEEDILIKEHKGEEYVFAVIHRKGENTKTLLANHMPELIKSIYFPKNMRWGGKNIRFARPIRWILSLFNDEVISFDFEGIPVGNLTYGHRFLGKNPVSINSIDEYEKKLEENYVILDQNKRRDEIIFQSKHLAKSLGGEIEKDEDLLTELTYIVEYPTAVLGKIKPEYLKLPPIVITTPMREHLRYIPVYDQKGELLPYFITIRNGNDEYIDIVAKGNERVLGARLEDAKFFYEEDLQTPLEDNVEKLDGILFQEKLGTIKDKTSRVKSLSRRIGESLAIGETADEILSRAAEIAKADLVTHMVQEFTELQGTMGKIYALEMDEKEIVAQAIEEQYLPRSAGDALPESTTGTILSIADKLDTIVGLFAIDKIPTGSQDPFGLRRSAIGILRMIENKKWSLSLQELIDASLYIYIDQIGLTFDHMEVKSNILDFFSRRILQMLRDRGISYDIIDSIHIGELDDVLDVFEKAEKLSEFFEEDRKSFVDAAVRVSNLATHYEEGMDINPDLLESSEEKLNEVFYTMTDELDELLIDKKYDEVLEKLDEISPLIHDYFDHTMILTEDEGKKANRLRLLHDINLRIRSILDVHKIVTE